MEILAFFVGFFAGIVVGVASVFIVAMRWDKARKNGERRKSSDGTSAR